MPDIKDDDLTPQSADAAATEPAVQLPANPPHLSLVVNRDAPDADRLNTQYRQLQSAAHSMLAQAIVFGDMLIAEQKLMEHGEWKPWVAANCVFSYESAASYMNLARNKDKFSALNFSSMRRAIAFLDEKKHKDQAEPDAEPKAKPKAKPRQKKDPDLALDELPPEQRKIVQKIIDNHDLVSAEKFNQDKTIAVEKAVAARMWELDRREAQLAEREIALDRREEALREREQSVKVALH